MKHAIAIAAGLAAGAAGATQLTVIVEEVPDYDIVRALSADFAQEHPGIEVVFEAMPFDAMRDRIITSALAPTATYDVIIVDNPWMEEFARAGYLEPLRARIEGTPGYDYDDFFTPLAAIGEVEGEIYGVPYYNYALGLIVRQDLIEAAGLAAPDSLAAFMALARSLTTDDMRGIAMQPQRGYKIMEEWTNWLFASGGALFAEDGSVVVDSPEAVAALEAYIETHRAAAPANSLNWGFDEALRSVASGGSAMMLSYNWMLPTLNAPDGPAGDLAGSFRLHPVPGRKAVLGAWHWAIAANAADKDAAWAFISWLTAPDTDRARVIAGGAPTRESVTRDPDVWAQGFGEDYYATVAEILATAQPLATGVAAEEIIEIVGTELSEAVSGAKSPADALADARRRVERVR
ncbi:ABC transporter substrate-binding protein [Rubrimonas sp.]|uniref:ABC transporter substrate-binding protein n=1 Tax=Rubrimonas sp. TaxID=2036015 RepID=UPI002FDC7D23